MQRFRRVFASFSIIIFTIVIFVLAWAVQQRLFFRPRAGGALANIVVDARAVVGPMPQTAMALAQGGEEPARMLAPVVGEIAALSPRLIRIDHIYDHYDVVQIVNGAISYDFSKLDRTVSDILAAGAVPYLSLSYMPKEFSDDLTGVPRNWLDWENLVSKTIEHYSGRSQMNIAGVYYECWNEPDLFGRWGRGGDKSYFRLYYHCVRGADGHTNTQPFYIGGPAITAPYPNWLSDFLVYVTANNLRLDFLSWHRYSTNPEVFAGDAQLVDDLLANFPSLSGIQKIVSEWNYNSENDPVHDSGFGGSFSLAALKRMIDKGIDHAASFEIKDGPSPNGSQYWGRWGLITHEKSGLKRKPRYHALKLLSRLKGQRLQIAGEGSWVEGLAAVSPEGIRVLLFNFDPTGNHNEVVPVAISGLSPGIYRYRETWGDDSETNIIEQPGGSTVTKTISLNSNKFVLIELTQLSGIGRFVPNKSGEISDQAIVLDNEKGIPLEISVPGYSPQRSIIQFDFKPDWEGTSSQTIEFFSISVSDGKRLVAQKNNDRIVFGINESGQFFESVSASISRWSRDSWKTLSFAWDENNLFITFDGVTATSPHSTGEPMGTVIRFVGGGGAIDNVLISDGVDLLTVRRFDGQLDK